MAGRRLLVRLLPPGPRGDLVPLPAAVRQGSLDRVPADARRGAGGHRAWRSCGLGMAAICSRAHLALRRRWPLSPASRAVVSYAAFPSVMAPLGLSSITSAAAILRVGLPLMLPVSFVSGMFFPCSAPPAQRDSDSEIANGRRPHACQHHRRRARLARRRVRPAAAARHRELVLPDCRALRRDRRDLV